MTKTSQVEKSDIKINHRFLYERIRSYPNIVHDNIRSYEKSYEKTLSLQSYIRSYTKLHIWTNTTLLYAHIRSYSKIITDFFTTTHYSHYSYC